MDPSSYLESLPLNKIARYAGGPPKDAVLFTGYPQQHPAEKDKIILFYDPLGGNPLVLEFKVDDILFVGETQSAVTESGEGVPLVRLWVRRGACGVIMEPFEVDEPVQFAGKTGEIRGRFLKLRSADSVNADPVNADGRFAYERADSSRETSGEAALAR